MQYKVPQNVGIEDKIVGPLTLRQLIMISVGVGISYTLFAILNKLYEVNVLEYIVIGLPALLATAFALIKIQDITLFKYLILFLEFSIKPKKRVWDHHGVSFLTAPDLNITKKETSSNKKSDLNAKSEKVKNLKELTRTLDSGGFAHLREVEHTDIDSISDDNLVSQAYFGHKKNQNSTKNMYWRTVESHKTMLNEMAKCPVEKLKKGTKETNIIKNEVKKIKKEVEDMKQVKAKKRKRRTSIQPVRKDNHIDTTTKNKPAKYVSKNEQVKKSNTISDQDEFDLRELQKGEIDINLD